MKKTLMVCTAILALISCTRIKNKIESVITNSEVTECNIGSLYPDLDGKDCIGVKTDQMLYFSNYYFRYKATPAEVQNALMAKECSYVEIVPDTVLVPCDEKYILDNMQMLSEEVYPEFVEWRCCDHPDSLEFYECTKTPLQHLFVFDKGTGYMYHFISSFRE